MKLGNNFTFVNVDKTRVKLFPNFICHHFITYTILYLISVMLSLSASLASLFVVLARSEYLTELLFSSF